MNFSGVYLLCCTGSNLLNKNANHIIFCSLDILYQTLFHHEAIISVILCNSYEGLCPNVSYTIVLIVGIFYAHHIWLKYQWPYPWYR